MLRSRARGGGLLAHRSARTSPNAWLTSGASSVLRGRTRRRFFCLILCLCAFLAGALVVFCGLLSGAGAWRSARGTLEAANHITRNQTKDHYALENDSYVPATSPVKPTWKYPLVSREMLSKLDRMQQFYAPGYYDLNAAPEPTAITRTGWPPRVTRIPERLPRLGPSAPRRAAPLPDALCESAAHPRPCRFLLPLRVAEQESKARMHLTQIALLARALGRTLVLPGVGKSKIGACFRWDFGTYYDAASLAAVVAAPEAALAGSKEWFIGLEDFRAWLDDQEGRSAIKSQLVSIGATLPARTKFRAEAVYSNADVSVLAYDTFGAWERDLPGCFAGKFEQLELETMPVFISAPNTTNKDGSVIPIGGSLLEAFSALAPRNDTWVDQTAYEMPFASENRDDHTPTTSLTSLLETEVMVVDWDLRHPVFLPYSQKPFQYSQRMHDLAEKYAPKEPYLVVQWRMESVDASLLEDCAHALVDVLSRLLHDSVLAANITSVWFASDYPYPIVQHKLFKRRPGLIAKSGTFRDFEIRHEEAIEILRSAFNKQGELNSWTLTDFAEVLEQEKHIEIDLLHDSGVLAILDKLVSIRANLFVSGASRCSRRSSFTKQVVDARGEEWSRAGKSHLRNVVEIFG